MEVVQVAEPLLAAACRAWTPVREEEEEEEGKKEEEEEEAA